MNAEAIQPVRRARTDAPLRLLGDDRLARMAAEGSRAAVAVLCERHYGALLRYAGTIVRHQDDAQDVVQTTMANAMAALGRGVPNAPLRPWLFRIAHNEAISALRRRRPLAEFDEAQITDGRGLQQTVEDRERLALLVADLQALPERQRGALVMRELSGLSHREIGTALDIPAAKAKQAILEARTSLMAFESGRQMDCAEVRRIVSDRDGRKLRGRTMSAHLRSCSDCAALRNAIHTRQSDLAMLAPPVPAGLSAALLAHLLGHGGAGLAGKAAGTTLLAKVAVGAAILATVGTGIGVTEIVRHHDRPSRHRAKATPTLLVTPTPSTREILATPTSHTKTSVARSQTSGRSVARHPARTRASDHRRRSRHPVPLSPSGDRLAGTPQAPGHATPTTTSTPATSPAVKNSKPVKRTRPAKTPRPVNTVKPIRTPKPAKTPRPAATPKPAKTPGPVRKPDPAVTVAPATPTPTAGNGKHRKPGR